VDVDGRRRKEVGMRGGGRRKVRERGDWESEPGEEGRQKR